jgi:hypothetical protein
MKRDMHEIFREAFKGLSLEAVRLIVGHRNSPIIQRELIPELEPVQNFQTGPVRPVQLLHRSGPAGDRPV